MLVRREFTGAEITALQDLEFTKVSSSTVTHKRSRYFLNKYTTGFKVETVDGTVYHETNSLEGAADFVVREIFNAS